MKEEHALAGIIAPVAIAALIGIGKLLHSDANLTTRVVVGRAISSGGLGVLAFALLAWIPDAPDELLWAASAGLSSLGTSVLEGLAHKYLGNAGSKKD